MQRSTMLEVSLFVFVSALAAATLSCTSSNPDNNGLADGQVDGQVDGQASLDLGPDDGGIDVVSATDKVQVYTDEKGVRHIHCQKDLDCLYGLGYVHAASRFYWMDISRRSGKGTLASLFGEDQAQTGLTARQYLSTRQGQPLEQALWEDLDDESRKWLEAYARGVNRWLEDLAAGEQGARLSEEYEVLPVQVSPESLPAWTAQDSLLLLVMVQEGNSLSNTETYYDTPANVLPPALYQDMFGMSPAVDSPVLPSSASAIMQAGAGARPKLKQRKWRAARQRSWRAPAAAVRAVRQHVRHLQRMNQQLGLGNRSNNWAVAPKATGSASTFLANDPHGTMLNPPTTMLVSILSDESLHAAGATMPGLPLVVIGHNEDLAWGVTTSMVDEVDYYVDYLSADKKSVLFLGNEVALIEKTLQTEVPGQEPVSEERYWVPHHGPVIYEDPEQQFVVAVRWVGHEAFNDFAGLRQLMSAATMEQAQQALASIGSLSLNYLVAHRQGRIGWRVSGKIPARPWAGPASGQAPWRFLLGDGSTEWQGWLDESVHPQLWDPPAGYVSTANNDLTGHLADGDPTNDVAPYMQAMVSPGYRHQRIISVLAAGAGKLDLQQMHDLQADTLLLPGQVIAPELVAIADQHPTLINASGARLVQALRNWAFTCPTGLSGIVPSSAKDPDPEAAKESIGCSAFHVLMMALRQAVFLDEFTHHGLTTELFNQVSLDRALYLAFKDPGALTSGEALWDDLTTAEVETRQQTVALALNGAGAWMAAEHGDDIDDWRWGRVRVLVLPSTPQRLELGLGPYANSGGDGTVCLAMSVLTEQGLTQVHGAHMRMVCELGPEGVVSYLQLAGPQDLHRDSPYYEVLLEDYLRHQPYRLPFSATEVQLAAVEQVELSVN